MVNIVLDCMGGENSPKDLVKGAVLALNENENINLIKIELILLMQMML